MGNLILLRNPVRGMLGFARLGDFHKPWIHQIVQFSVTAIASCVFPILDNENILQKRREREKLKRAFELAEQKEQGLEKQRDCDRKRQERNTSEVDGRHVK